MGTNDFYIVCVDDDTEVLEITSALVESFGYKSISFNEAQKACEYIKENKHKVSLVLSDLRMDHLNGFEFKKKLKSFASEIPFIIITGYWTKEMSSEAMAAGIDAFVEKPISEDVLKANIENFAQVRMEILEEEREMVEGFLDESTPMLDEIEQLILELEETPDSEQTLSIYFRLLHTIKGTASCVGLNRLGSYTHTYEDFIGELRNKVIPVNTASVNVLLEGLDDLKKFFDYVKEEGADYNLEIDNALDKYNTEHLANDLPNAEKTEQKVVSDEAEVNKTAKKDDDKMNISMSLLNEFMEESGELTVIRNTILKTVKKIENKFRGDQDIELLNDLLGGMYDVTSNIQGKITEMRKVPLKNTFRPFKRLVRDLSKQLKKNVEFEVKGEETSVDNIVAKLYNNTLIHIIRNSLDHGLETSEQRKQQGKDEVGQLLITVEEIGEDIVMKIIDDGKGIDPTVIKKKAVEKGLYTSEEINRMSSLEIVNIIFDSGFSTAEQVSDLSGRGVGMDMVRGSFENMGGSVYVESEVGKGSVFTLSVPIPKSVLIINTLSVSTSKQNFIFNMDEVVEVVRYVEDQANSKMYNVDGQKVLCHNESMIQLADLSHVLKLEDRDVNEFDVLNIVVLRSGGTKFGLIVDEIYDFEEVVSRNLHDYIHSKELFHGASLLGTGEVALVLASEGLAIAAGINIEAEKPFALADLEVEQQENNVNEYMLFKHSQEEYMCIELDYVERLEKIQLNQLESVGDNYIVRYLNKSMPIFDPVHFIGLKEKTVLDELRKKDDHELIELIVVNYEGMRFGFVVYELDEIQYSFEQVNTDTIVDEGLLGSIYIQNDTICILDLDYIYHKFCSAKKTLVKRDHDIYADVELDKTA